MPVDDNTRRIIVWNRNINGINKDKVAVFVSALNMVAVNTSIGRFDADTQVQLEYRDEVERGMRGSELK